MRPIATTALAVLFLTARPPDRLTAGLDRLAAQSITVVAQPGFNARIVQQVSIAFGVAADSAAGGAVVTGLNLGGIIVAGGIRVDGITPFARGAEMPGYADSVRFEPDGRVVLLAADRATRGPITVEPRALAGAAAGRLLLGAAGWPADRVLVVTIDPADLWVSATGRGRGQRDRIRLDQARGVVYLSDSAVGGVVAAIGMGRGASGRVQTEVSSVLLDEVLDGRVVGRDRRTVNRIVFFIEPQRGDDGTMRAELVFGAGRGEAEALAAAQSAQLVAAPVPLQTRITTPSADVALALIHALATAEWAAPGQRGHSTDSLASGGAALWRQVVADAGNIVRRDYGRPDSASAVAVPLEHRVLRGLFGLRTIEGGVRVAPLLDGAADAFEWVVEGWRFSGDALRFAYRPASLSATLRLGAVRRTRIELKFPWLDANGCVTVRRGPDAPERLPLVILADGAGYVDVRAGFEPAEVTVARACAP